MNIRGRLWAALAGAGWIGATTSARADADAWFDRVGESLRWASADARFAAHVSGAFDLEAYAFGGAAPGFIATDRDTLFNPRLALALDAQAGPEWYGFVQARWDRGYDPAAAPGRARLDEYAVRFTPAAVDGTFSLQAGKFATVAGAWPARHGSWQDAFVTPPLAYGGASTPLWDTAALRAPATLFNWAYLNRTATAADRALDRERRVPLVWGAAYAHGAALTWRSGRFDLRLEAKGAALAASPYAWRETETLAHRPTWTTRLGWRPGPEWSFGATASRGPYLRDDAATTLPPGLGLRDFRQELLGVDVGWARRHWQVWGELLAARFKVPGVGDAPVTSGFVEVRRKLAPRFTLAGRVNRQWYGDLGSTGRAWGHATTRWEFAPVWRFTPHVQVKLQLSTQREDDAARRRVQDAAAQLTVRF